MTRHRYQKGHPRYGAGRAGIPNKTTRSMRQAIEMCYEGIGGVERLMAWANKNNDNLTVFYTRIWLRLLPHKFDVTKTADLKVMKTIDDVRAELERRKLPQLAELGIKTDDLELPQIIEHREDEVAPVKKNGHGGNGKF